MLKYEIVPVTGFEQNCSILWDDETKEAAIIDAGGDVEKITKIIDQHQLKPVALWNTHGHLDHVGAVGELEQRYQLPVLGPNEGDRFWIDGLVPQSRQFGLPTPKTVNVSKWLKDGDEVQLGKHKLEVRFTPGHTPGHVVFYSKDLGTVWVGDVLFSGSIGRTDFPGGNHQQLLDSIREKLMNLPDETVVVSGHGPRTKIGIEKHSNPFLVGQI